MGRISEAIMRLILRERRLQSLKRDVPKGGTAVIDVFLRKGTEYVVRGRVLMGRGAPVMSLRDVAGSVVPTRRSGKGKSFSVIPEKDGLYRIRAVAKPAVDQGSATVAVILSCVVPVPQYILNEITALSCGFIRPGYIEDGPTETAPEAETAAGGEYIQTRTA